MSASSITAMPVAAVPVLEKLLDTFEVAEILGVSPDWVRAHSNGNRQPALPSVSLGKLIRFRRADVEAFIEAQRTAPKKPKFRIM